VHSSNLVLGWLVVDGSQWHVSMVVGVLVWLLGHQLVITRLQGISNRGSVAKHLSITVGVPMSEVVLVSISNVVTSSHWAVSSTEHILVMTMGFDIMGEHSRSVGRSMAIIFDRSIVLGKSLAMGCKAILIYSPLVPGSMVIRYMAMGIIRVHHRSVIGNMAMRHMDIRSRHNINMVDIILDLRGVFRKSMVMCLDIRVHNRAIISSMALG